MRNKTIVFAFVASVLITGCGNESASVESSAPPEEKATRIAIVDFAFDPETVEAAVGDTIVWTNEDDIAHTVTSGRAKKQGVPGVSENRDAVPDGLFDSGTMELNDTFEFVAEQSGTLTYFCAIHAGMSAQLVIR